MSVGGFAKLPYPVLLCYFLKSGTHCDIQFAFQIRVSEGTTKRV
ncbi:hypothetical protein RSAG8_11283, partial [Rhizoctonia solani AG-8 WAC10335]